MMLYYNNLKIQHMKNLKKLPLILSLLSFLTIFAPANAEIKVVAAIKPIHSLASYLMDGVGKPDLIVDGYASPHGFALKPSHAKMIQNADIIFWVGEDIETFLEKPLKTIAKDAEKIEGLLSPEIVAEKVYEAMCREEFLILPHSKVQKYLTNKVSDYDRWIDGMQKLKKKSITKRGSAKPLDILHLV